jgi:signal transduction histidine kinase
VEIGRMSRAGRLRLTGYAALQLLLSVPALVVFVLDVLAMVLSIVVVGVPLLMVLLPVTRWLAERHRRMAGAVLGVDVPASYQPAEGAGAVGRLRIAAADPMTWRDLLWLLVAMPLAFTASLTVLVLFVPVVTGVAWWYAVGPVMYYRSRVDRWLLSFGTTERLEQRVEVLTQARNQTLDHAATELRRIERDLHDGAQARLASLAMTLGMAAELLERDPKGRASCWPRRGRPAARHWATCVTWCTGSTRRCSPTAGSGRRSRRSPSTCRYRWR